MSDLPPMTEHRRARFDPTITLGHVMTTGSVIATMVAGYASLNTRMGVVETQIATMTTLMERTIRADEKLQGLGVQLGKLEDRIERVESR